MYTFNEKLSLVEKAVWAQVRKNDHNEVQIEENWVQVTTPSAPVAHLNGVFKCSLSVQEASERISETIEHYKNLKLPFRFKISPSSRPENISSILLQHNLEKKETLYGLYADPNNLTFPKNPEVEIKLLNLSTLEDWLIVQTSAWGVPAQGIEYLRKQMENTLKVNVQDNLDFIAYYNQKPVASAALRIYDGFALLVGGAVTPAERKKGIYRSLLSYRLDIIKNLNLPAIIHCLENTSAPICLKLGFEKICEIYSFEPKILD